MVRDRAIIDNAVLLIDGSRGLSKGLESISAWFVGKSS